ncbi:hypothetical protein [Modicisalibacter luteus]|uniref:Uncharacterized protein n=1 Tax=Modicisalibacter luteus TaxID=453962 RepID=A0ABV7LXE1_9GAMM|nr:hypothetical protein [Halomonas lutea]
MSVVVVMAAAPRFILNVAGTCRHVATWVQRLMKVPRLDVINTHGIGDTIKGHFLCM